MSAAAQQDGAAPPGGELAKLVEAQQAPVPAKTDKKAGEQADAGAAGAPKLSGAELKAKAKAEKAARRAQAKNTKDVAKAEAAVSSSPQQLGPSAGEVKSGKGLGKDKDGSAQAGRPAVVRAPASTVLVEPKIQIPDCFSHLSMAKRLPMTQADKDVHPSVLALGQQMATFALDESINRLKATLLAFKQVIASYTTPPGHTLARHFTPHVLNPQIEYLTACRPMCFSMGNAVRWLKLQVSKIDVDSPEEEAKRDLCESIDSFVQERITVADLVITKAGADHIQSGDEILTFGRSSLVERTLKHARSSGKAFSVFVIDDPFDRSGQQLAKNLTAEGISVTYSGDFGGLRPNMANATKVVLGAEAMFGNGAMYARSGSCDTAIAARELGLPVIALCETINITERVTTDSLTYNEIDPERSSAASFRLLFDTTLEKYLSMVITELGSVQPTSVPDLLRKLEEFS